MPNKFSQPVNTPFVPTYQPIDLGVVNQSAQQMQNKQDSNMLAYDTLREKMNQFQLAEADKPLLEDAMNEAEQSLSQFEDTGDFINATGAIRKEAMKFSTRAQSGDLYKAQKNFNNMTENTKKLNEWDAPVRVREAMKNQMLANYKGVEEGDVVGEVALPEYKDGMELAVKYAKDIEPKEYEQFGILTETIGEGDNKREVYMDATGSTKRVVRSADAIKKVVTSRLMNDPKYMDYIAAEAKALSPDDPQEYIRKSITNAVTTAVDTKEKDNKTISGVKAGESWQGDDPDVTGVINLPGLLNASSYMPKDFDSFSDSLHNAYLNQEKDPETFEAKKGNLKYVLGQMRRNDELDSDEVNYFMDKFEENGFLTKTKPDDFRGSTGTAGRESDILRGIQNQQGFENTTYSTDEQFREIYDKVNSFVSERGDVVTNNLQFTSDKKADHFRKLFSRSINDRNMRILNQDLSEKEKKATIHEIEQKVRKGEASPQITYTEEGVMYDIEYEEDGEYKSFLLEENVQDVSQQPYQKSLTNYVASLVGGHEGSRLDKVFAMRHINPYSGENIYDKLPPNLKPTTDEQGNEIDFIKMDNQGKKTYMYAGAGDDVKPYSYYDYLIDNAPDKSNQRDPLEFQRILNELNTKFSIFSPEEIKYMVRNRRVIAGVKERLQSSGDLDTAYPFNDAVEAISYIN